jgi:hypothetical protein
MNSAIETENPRILELETATKTGDKGCSQVMRASGYSLRPNECVPCAAGDSGYVPDLDKMTGFMHAHDMISSPDSMWDRGVPVLSLPPALPRAIDIMSRVLCMRAVFHHIQ